MLSGKSAILDSETFWQPGIVVGIRAPLSQMFHIQSHARFLHGSM
jgi:hypothetical protein